MRLAEQIAEAEGTLARLKLAAQSATCADLGHDWKFVGGCNAGCDVWCACSVPVHECNRCGVSDYGDTAEGDEVRRRCAEERV